MTGRMKQTRNIGFQHAVYPEPHNHDVLNYVSGGETAARSAKYRASSGEPSNQVVKKHDQSWGHALASTTPLEPGSYNQVSVLTKLLIQPKSNGREDWTRHNINDICSIDTMGIKSYKLSLPCTVSF